MLARPQARLESRCGWCLTLLGLLPGACSPAPAGDGAGLLVIVVDAWRADRQAGLGQSETNQRRFARFLEGSVQFDSAWSTAPEMAAAHSTLLTGCDPRLARIPEKLSGVVDSREEFLPPDVPRIAEHLLAHGWRTAAFVDDVSLAGPIGFSQGFQRFEDPGMALRYRSRFDPYGIDGVARRFHEWVRGLEQGERWFAYLQLSDLDRMWSDLDSELGQRASDSPGSGRALLPTSDGPTSFFTVSRSRDDGLGHSLQEYKEAYDRALARLTRKFGGLLTALDRLGWSQRMSIVLVGSYGFGFGESGLLLDSGTLSDVDLRVPLLIRPHPALGLGGGRVVDQLVSTLDVVPTLYGLTGVARPDGVHGESLMPLLEGQDIPLREYAFASSSRVGGYAVIDQRYCYESRDFSSASQALVASWYGLDRPTPDELQGMRSGRWEVLHDREMDDTLGHLDQDREPRSLRQGEPIRLREAGEEWNRLVELAAIRLHDPQGNLLPLSADEIDELHRRHMIGARGPGAVDER